MYEKRTNDTQAMWGSGDLPYYAFLIVNIVFVCCLYVFPAFTFSFLRKNAAVWGMTDSLLSI